jgi:hypothetical protein
MPGYTLKSMKGVEGEITVPSLGMVIGTMQKWSLVRREDGSRSSGYRLHAVFSYLNPMFFKESSLTKQITIAIRDRDRKVNKQYRLEVIPGQETRLEGMSLLIEGVTLWPLETPTPSSRR